MEMTPTVHVVKTEPAYPEPAKILSPGLLDEAFDSMFRMWGLDPQNPFAGWVKPGGTVVLKPNWVLDFNSFGHSVESLVTHPAIICRVVRYAARALEGRGTIVVGDAPLQGCDLGKLHKLSGFEEAMKLMETPPDTLQVLVEDWRLTKVDRSGNRVPWAEWMPVSEADEKDLAGYRLVDRATESFLEDLAVHSDNFRVTCYKPSLMLGKHEPGKHQYLVTRRVLDADLVVNLPKMKTHIKAGLTGALKNLVGINGHKAFLPHHTKGSWLEGGDNYPTPGRFQMMYEDASDAFFENHEQLSAFQRRASSKLMHVIWRLAGFGLRDKAYGGSWRHNETIWRTTLDLNHVLYFSEHGPRKVCTIVDGIVAGDAEGPLTPSPRPAGLLVGGENPAYVDAVLGRLMGYNVARVPTVHNAIHDRRSRFAGPLLKDYVLKADLDASGAREMAFHELPNFDFVKPALWRGADLKAGAGK